MSNEPPLSPPIDPDRSPPFHEMSGYPLRFERLTLEVMNLEPELHRALLFRPDGEKQFGIDVLADLRGGAGIDVASCKCQERVRPGELKTWSTDFLKHWDDEWKGKHVRRFILVVATDNIETAAFLTARDVEKARFEAFGVDYEVWGARQLAERLRASRSVVVHRLGEVWADRLCGVDSAKAALAQALDRGQALALHGAQQSVEEQARARIIAITLDLQHGETDRAALALASLRAPMTWLQLPQKSQGAVARLEGSLALLGGDRALAQSFCTEGLALDPAVRRLAALLCSTPEESLAALGEPATLEDRQARTMYLVGCDQKDDAAAALDALELEAPDHPETLRLRAFFQIHRDDRAGALATAVRAETEAPLNLGILRLAVLARYAVAVSPRVDIGRLLRPYSLPHGLVRGDDDSRRHLEAALERIERVIAKSRQVDDRRWRLAILCVLERYADAAELASALLAEDPADAIVAGWALAHQFQFDAPASRDAMQAAFEAGRLDENDLHTLAWLLSLTATPLEMAIYFEEHFADFEMEGQGGLQRIINMLRGEERGPDEESGFGLLSELSETNSADVDWPALEARLAALFGMDSPPPVAFLFANAVAERGRWSALEPYLQAILDFATPDAIALGAHVAHFTRPAQELLDILTAQASAFPQGALPLVLRRMESLALHGVGDVAGALQVAERLAVETQAPEDRLNLIQLQLGAGSVSAALPWIRRAFTDKQISGGDAVRFSLAVTTQDAEFARELWRFALQAGVPDALVLNAYSQAFALGLDLEVGPLSLRMQALAAAGAPNIWVLDDVQDVVDQVLRRREASERMLANLEAGATPVHFTLGVLDSLARVYRLDRPGSAGALAPIYIRHGGRPAASEPNPPWSSWCVLLDLTGLLLADQLDLLRFVEGLDRPIRISTRLIDALYQLREQAATNQPSYVEAARAIVLAADDQRLGIAEMSDFAEPAIVRHDRDRGPAPEDIVETLRRLEAGPVLGSDAPPLPVELNAQLLFEEDTLSNLAVHGLLDQVLLRFQCRLTTETIADLKAKMRAADDQTALAARLVRLRERVAAGLQSGRYVSIGHERFRDADDEEPPKGEEGGKADAENRFDDFAGGLVDLLKAPSIENGVVWADDRYVSGFRKAQDNRIVGVVDVLNALRDEGLITVEDRRHRLIKLRAAGALYIPMDAEEVMAALRAAPLHGPNLFETSDLAALRRSFGLGVLVDRNLKVGDSGLPQLVGRPDEVDYLFAMRGLADACLVQIWSEEGIPLELRKARSAWIWSNLRMPYGARFSSGEYPDEAAFGLAALQLAASLGIATAVRRRRLSDSLQAQRNYLDWLSQVAIQPIASQPALLDAVAARFCDLMASDRNQRSPEQVEAIRHLRNMQTDLLPPLIRERVLADRDYAAFVGVQMNTVQTLNDANFPADNFWRAVVRALRQGKATVKTIDGKQARFTEQDGTIVCSGAAQGTLNDPILAVLKLSGEARDAAALAWAGRLDLAPAVAAQLRADLVKSRTDRAYADALTKVLDHSTIRFYGRLRATLRSGRLKCDDLRPPPAKALLHHLRLADLHAGTVAERARSAWPVLKAEIGPAFALRRLAALPIDLGSVLVADPDSAALLAELERGPTPMMRFHLARLSALLGDEALAGAQFAVMADAGLVELEMFCDLLRWSEIAFAGDPDWRTLGVPEQLAVIWAHAERVMAALVESPPSDWAGARQFISSNPLPRPVSAALVSNPVFSGDMAAPDHLTPAGLLYHSLGLAFPAGLALARLPEAAKPAFMALMVSENEGVIEPSATVIIRREGLGNAMESFLGNRPNLFDAELDPIAARVAMLNEVLVALEVSTTDQGAWAKMAALGKTGLEGEHAARLNAIFDRLDLKALARTTAGLGLIRLVLATRLRQSPKLSDNDLWLRLHEIGEGLANRLPSAAALESVGGRADFVQVVEILGACAVANDGGAAMERLQQGCLVLADVWPAAANVLRGLLGAIATQHEVRDGRIAWRGFTALQTFP